jgi:hypothetical protein
MAYCSATVQSAIAYLSASLQSAIASCHLFEMFAQQTFQCPGQGASAPCAGPGARSPGSDGAER